MLEVASIIVSVCCFVVLAGPSLLVSVFSDQLPDPRTGFRHSDALPLLPPAYFRFLRFVFSPTGLQRPLSGLLVRLLRLAIVVAYGGCLTFFVWSISQNAGPLDPELLKTDQQRSDERRQPHNLDQARYRYPANSGR